MVLPQILILVFKIYDKFHIYSEFQLGNAIQTKLVEFGRARMPRSRYNGG